jgi:uncharacterized protein YuzE
MATPYSIQVTFRRGKPVAAYILLHGRAGDRAASTRQAGEGIVVDYLADGRPMGIEIVSPSRVDAATLNAVLAGLSMTPLTDEDLRPLAA